ncbi:MAG: hypothetical protein JXA35_05230 [Deltaproteobacteria bacterium]|nr:hypothetical protein [Deltaproteobacteria bacterium]
MNGRPEGRMTAVQKYGVSGFSGSGTRKTIMIFPAVYLLLVILVLAFPLTCAAYVMPAEQIADMMTANFAKFRTLIITQSVRSENLKNKDIQLIGRETLWLRSPDLYYLERDMSFSDPLIDRRGTGSGTDDLQNRSLPVNGSPETRLENYFLQCGMDSYFRQLFMAGGEDAIILLLKEMGIDSGRTGLTRINGAIAYRIGDGDPDSPKLIIDKERFLPVFVRCRVPAGSEYNSVAVTFGDYRRLPEGWYPFEIICHVEGSVLRKRFSVTSLKVNTPVEKSLSKIPEFNNYSVQTFEYYRKQYEGSPANDIK